ncbi:hypothetical protein [Pseudomonas sp. M30-35]|uniref:hypothetical protein n=1 Tax=Pseudomonas sp. M30-35 TaxID=1981174 RepID=UPI000B3C1958|nr:hypothetical protein [Pseudomonas sp. M30-35]ARU87461.1 hypothetical protein B9K09_05510 [Pseudomonas sp. M30-35]
MSLINAALKQVTISNVFGRSYEDGIDETSPGFKARFGLSINSEDFGSENGYSFQVTQNFEAVFSEKEEPFFRIEIIGHFCALRPNGMKEWIDTEEAAYILGATLYPYLRNLSKPLLEGLGSAQVDFPWSSPPISKITQKKVKRKTTKKN